MTVILFLIILAVLIFVHELGHFTVAKLFGIRVDEFALGFPPKLIAKKIGETTYSLNAIPFGGFVKIFGENGEEGISHEAIGNPPERPSTPFGRAGSEEERKRSFAHKPKWIQALVLLAGIAMNIVFGYVLISICFMIGMPTPVGVSNYGQVSHTQLVITSVLPNSPAQHAGLVSGDVILSVEAGNRAHIAVEGENISPESVSDVIAHSEGPITLTYTRGKHSPATVSLIPVTTIVTDRRAVGISMDMIGLLKLSLPQALLQGADTSWQLVKGIVLGLGAFIAGFFTHTSNLSDVSGPIGIAKVVGQARAIGFVYVLSLVALISFNLAIINLIPFPALDGGRLFFILIESVTRRKISTKMTMWVNGIGFALLIVLMVVVSFHDVWGIL